MYFLNIFLLFSVILHFGSGSSQLFKRTRIHNELDYKSASKLPKPKLIELPVDHFNASDKRTWKMKYYEVLDHFKEEGPIILIPDSCFPWIKISYLVSELAKRTNGAVYAFDPRFTFKLADYPLTVKDYRDYKNYKYLSIKQKLADAVALLEMIKAKPEYKNSKVVAMGGDRGGNQAAWLRLLHPDLIDAAYAGSAAMNIKVDAFELYETVNEILQKYCAPSDFEAMKTDYARYDELLKTDAGMTEFKEEMLLCDSIDLHKPHNIHTFYETMMITYWSDTQFLTPTGIKKSCAQYTKIRKGPECINMTWEVELDLIKQSPTPAFYEACNEYGQFGTLASDKQVFKHHLPIEYFYDLCKGLYGPDFTEDRIKRGVEETKKVYGGLTPNVTKVLFVSCDMDAASRLAITKDLSPEAPARLIPLANVCQDMFPVSENQPQVTETQEFALKTIIKWIGL